MHERSQLAICLVTLKVYVAFPALLLLLLGTEEELLVWLYFVVPVTALDQVIHGQKRPGVNATGLVIT